MGYPPRNERYKKQATKSKRKIVQGSLFMLIIVGIGIFVGYVSDDYTADDTAYALLESTETVQYVGEEPIHFAPTKASDVGFIFYPGGKVDAVAYTSLMQPLAEAGIHTFIPQMPFQLAVLDMDAADAIMAEQPEINHWYVGGHSLGAAMAASYVADNQAKVAGLVLLAGYSTADLSESNLPVLALYGSEDQVIQSEKVTAYRANLPAETQEETIEGGNHAQFGRYGEQAGDGVASMAVEEQLATTITMIQTFISQQESAQ